MLRMPGMLAVMAQSPKLTKIRVLARTRSSSSRLSVLATPPSTRAMSTSLG